VKTLANIKSAKKRILVTIKKTLRNKAIKSRTKTAVKKVVSAAAKGDAVGAAAALSFAVKTIDKAASKGVYHKNNASRKKSRLAKLVNKIGA
jgi:small subunit ribosomal protein S20